MKNSIKFNPDGSVEFTGKKPNIKIIKPNKKGEYIGSYEIQTTKYQGLKEESR